MFEQYPDILSVEEACEALRIGYNAMYDLLNSGKLKAYKNGVSVKSSSIQHEASRRFVFQDASGLFT